MVCFTAGIILRGPRLKRAVWLEKWLDINATDAEEACKELDVSVRPTAAGSEWSDKLNCGLKALLGDTD